MVERLHHFQFALKTFELGGVAQHGLVGYFDNNFTAVHQIEGAVDIAHTTLSHVRLYLKIIELIPDLQHSERNYSIRTQDTNFHKFWNQPVFFLA